MKSAKMFLTLMLFRSLKRRCEDLSIVHQIFCIFFQTKKRFSLRPQATPVISYDSDLNKNKPNLEQKNQSIEGRARAKKTRKKKKRRGEKNKILVVDSKFRFSSLSSHSQNKTKNKKKVIELIVNALLLLIDHKILSNHLDKYREILSYNLSNVLRGHLYFSIIATFP